MKVNCSFKHTESEQYLLGYNQLVKEVILYLIVVQKTFYCTVVVVWGQWFEAYVF